MEFLVSRAKWDGANYWKKGKGCVISQKLRQEGHRVKQRNNAQMREWALTGEVKWLTVPLIDDLIPSYEFEVLDEEAENWLRKTLAPHGHTLVVVP